MIKGIFSPQIKNNPNKIKGAPDENHRHYSGRNGLKKSAAPYDHNAAHGNVDKGGNKVPFPGEKDLENNPYSR